MDTQTFTQNIRALKHLSAAQVERAVAMAEKMSPEERQDLIRELGRLDKKLGKAVTNLKNAEVQLSEIWKNARSILRQQEESDDRHGTEEKKLQTLSHIFDDNA